MNSDSSFYILQLEKNLKAAIELRHHDEPDTWLLMIKLAYDGQPAGTTSFTLNGYTRSEAENLASTLGSNEYLMKEIDDFLWGESD